MSNTSNTPQKRLMGPPALPTPQSTPDRLSSSTSLAIVQWAHGIPKGPPAGERVQPVGYTRAVSKAPTATKAPHSKTFKTQATTLTRRQSSAGPSRQTPHKLPSLPPVTHRQPSTRANSATASASHRRLAITPSPAPTARSSSVMSCDSQDIKPFLTGTTSPTPAPRRGPTPYPRGRARECSITPSYTNQTDLTESKMDFTPITPPRARARRRPTETASRTRELSSPRATVPPPALIPAAVTDALSKAGDLAGQMAVVTIDGGEEDSERAERETVTGMIEVLFGHVSNRTPLCDDIVSEVGWVEKTKVFELITLFHDSARHAILAHISDYPTQVIGKTTPTTRRHEWYASWRTFIRVASESLRSALTTDEADECLRSMMDAFVARKVAHLDGGRAIVPALTADLLSKWREVIRQLSQAVLQEAWQG